MGYRKTYEVTGYTLDGAAFCIDHKPDAPDNELGVIFLGDEWDQAPKCDVCFEPIDCTELDPQ